MLQQHPVNRRRRVLLPVVRERQALIECQSRLLDALATAPGRRPLAERVWDETYSPEQEFGNCQDADPDESEAEVASVWAGFPVLSAS